MPKKARWGWLQDELHKHAPTWNQPVSDDIQSRIRRLYTAIGETVEGDLSKFPPTTSTDGRYIRQTFRGDMSDEQIENAAHTALGHLAALRDHLQNWARRDGRDPDRVIEVLQANPALQIVTDLWNAEKHGYPLTRKTWSGRHPRLTNVARALAITPQQPGQPAQLRPSAAGFEISGGTGSVVLVGDIVDIDGSRIGQLAKVLWEAVIAWESLLQEFGLL